MAMDVDLRSRIHIIIVIVVVALLAVAGYFIRERYNTDTKPKKADTATVVPFATVKVARWHQQVQSIGTIAAKQSITLRAEVPGRITQFFVKSAESVTQGQKLIQLNPEVYKAEVNTAKANLQLSEYNFERAKQLYKDNAVSRAEYDNADYTMQADKAKLNEAIANLNLTLIRAPFAGKFGLKEVFLGEFLNPGDPVATLQSNQDLRVDFSIPGRFARLVKLGDKVTLTSDAFPDKTILGSIYAINAQLDHVTRALSLRADIGNPKITPNTYADVVLSLGKAFDVRVLPQTAVTMSVDGDYVYKVVNGIAVKTIIQAYQRRGTLVAVNGLKAGEVVVNGGQNKITDGDRVTDKGSPAKPVSPAVKLHQREQRFRGTPA